MATQIGDLQATITFNVQEALDSLDEFTQAISDATSEISSQLDEISNAFTDITDKVGVDNTDLTDSVDKMSIDVTDAINSMSNSVTDSINNMATSVEDRLASIDESMAALGTEADATGSSIGLGLGLGGGIGTAMMAFMMLQQAFKQTVGAFDSFQVKMFSLQDFAGIPASQIGQLTNKIQDLSTSTGVSTDDITQAMYHITSTLGPAMATGKQGMEALKLSAEGAAMGMGNAGDVGNLISGIMFNFGVSADKAFNSIIVGTKDGNMNLSDFTSNFTTLGQEAKNTNTSIDDTVAMFDTLTKATHDAAHSQTELDGIMRAFEKPNTTMNAIAQYLGYNDASQLEQKKGILGTLDLFKQSGLLDKGHEALMAKAFGRADATDAAKTITQSVAVVQSNLKDMENSIKAGSQAWDDYTKTNQFKLQTFGQQIQKVFKQIGNDIMQFINIVIQQAQPYWDLLMKTFKDNKPELQKVGEAIQFMGVLFMGAVDAVILITAGIVELTAKFIDLMNWIGSGKPENALINIFKDAVPYILDFFTAGAYSWGTNLIKMLGKGIKDHIPSLQGPAKDAAKAIESFLGIHSPAEMGPMSDADKWMPNLMNMFMGDLTKGLPALRNVLSTGLSGINQTLGGGGISPTGYGQNLIGASAAVPARSNTVNVQQNITVNGTQNPWQTKNAVQGAADPFSLSRLLNY